MGQGHSNRIRVLLVDDEPDVAELTATFLERAVTELSVDIAGGAREALERLGECVPDCIVSDYDMPGLDGLEFLAATRADYPDLPFILYTGQGSEAVASDAVSAGVTDYLQKGTGTERYDLLANRVTNAVEARRNARRASRQEELMRLTEFAGDTGGWEYDPATERFLLTDGACRLVGLEAGTRLSRSDALEQLHPDDRDAFERAFDHVVETGETDEGTWWFRTVEGRERLLHVTLTLAEDAGSVRVRGAMRDVTARRERRRELDILRQAIDDADVAIALTDPNREDNPLAYVNSEFEAVTGYDAEEVLGRNCRLLQGPATDPEKVARLRDAVAAEEPVTVELRNYRKDGTEFWNRLTVVPLYDESGELVRYLGTQDDVTDRKQRERALEATNERLDEFASIVSHDLRNPLNVASGHTELARETCDSEHLSKVAAAHDRMEQLIEELLEVSRAGTVLGERDPVALPAVVRDAWTNVSTGTATLAVETSASVTADRSRLCQLLENVFRNAIEHGGEEVHVTVESGPEGIAIEDDGPGIPESEREEVFETSYSTKNGGTGFGLKIVEEIANAHGWTVGVTEGADGGARFELTGVALD